MIRLLTLIWLIFPVLAGAVPPPKAGDLLGVTILESVPGLRYLKVRYLTPGVDGALVSASGLVIVPKDGETATRPLLSFQHGITAARTSAPSHSLRGPEMVAATAFFAARGYVIAAADGIGLGDSAGSFHPFLHAETEASASADLLRAVSKLSETEALRLSGQLFLAGYSQGGHWTMALHRALERRPIPGLNIVASAPMAGPFDLSETTTLERLRVPARGAGFYMAYSFFSMQSIYGNIVGQWSDALTEPSASRIARAFDGSHNGYVAFAMLAKSSAALFKPEFLEAVLSQPDHPLRVDLAKNNVYDWSPRAPIFLAHSKGDQVVPYQNSVLARARIARRGGTVELYTLPGTKSHFGGFIPAFRHAYERFEPLRKSVGEPAENSEDHALLAQ